MTVKQLGEEMDAPEFMEWMAYSIIQDEKQVQRLNQQIKTESDALFHETQLRNLFKSITKKKNGSKK